MTSGVTACQICGRELSEADEPFMVADATQFALWKPGLPKTIPWYRCDCGHVLSDYLHTDEEEALLFSTSEKHATPGHESDSERMFALETLDRIGLSQSIRKGGKVVDFGFGNGALALSLHERGYQVIGVDCRKAVVEEAERRYPWISWYEFFPEDFVDAVMMGDVIEHVKDVRALLTTIRKTRARFLWVSTPHADAWPARGDANHPLWRVLEHRQMFTPERLDNLLAEYGYRPTSLFVSRRYSNAFERCYHAFGELE